MTKTLHQQILEAYQPGHEEYRDTYIELYNAGRIINEAKLTHKQIKQIFSAIDRGVRAGKNVGPEVTGTIPKRGIIGSISNAWLKLKDKIAQSSKVDGFDVAADKLQTSILKKVGGQKGPVGQAIKKYRAFATKYPNMQGAIFTALSILSAMSGWGLGGMAVIGGIRTIDRLLQGDRLSSALWKGMKQVGIGALTHGISDYFGGGAGAGGGSAPWDPDVGSSGLGDASPEAPDVGSSGLGDASPEAPDVGSSGLPGTGTTDYVAKQNDVLSKIAKAHNVSVGELQKLNPEITNPDALAAGQHIKIPAPTGSEVYQGGVGTAADTLAKIKSGVYTDSPISRAMAAKAGLKESIVDYPRMKNNWQIQESMKLPRTSAIYLTHHGIDRIFESVANEGIWQDIKGAVKKGIDTMKTGITKEKLDLYWRKNFKEYPKRSVDSKVLIDFLHRMGVKDALIKSVWDELKIPTDDLTAATAAAAADTAGAGAGVAATGAADTAGARAGGAATGAADTAGARAGGAAVGSTADAGAPTGLGAAGEIEFPGTNIKFVRAGWRTTDGKPASDATAKVLDQLANGVPKDKIDVRDITNARRFLYQGAKGMTEQKKMMMLRNKRKL